MWIGIVTSGFEFSNTLKNTNFLYKIPWIQLKLTMIDISISFNFSFLKKRKKKSAQEIVQYIKIAWVNTLGDFMYQSYGLQHLPAQELWIWKTQSNTIVKTMTFELSLWCACAKTPFPLPLVCVCFSPKKYIYIYILLILAISMYLN